MLFPRRAVEINRFSEIPLCTCKRTQVSRTASASISPSEYFSQHFGNLRPIHEGKHNALICIPRAPFSTAWPAVISSCAEAAARGIARAQTVRQSETGGIDDHATPDIETMVTMPPGKNNGLSRPSCRSSKKINDPSEERPFTDLILAWHKQRVPHKMPVLLRNTVVTAVWFLWLEFRHLPLSRRCAAWRMR